MQFGSAESDVALGATLGPDNQYFIGGLRTSSVAPGLKDLFLAELNTSGQLVRCGDHPAGCSSRRRPCRMQACASQCNAWTFIAPVLPPAPPHLSTSHAQVQEMQADARDAESICGITVGSSSSTEAPVGMSMLTVGQLSAWAPPSDRG